MPVSFCAVNLQIITDILFSTKSCVDVLVLLLVAIAPWTVSEAINANHKNLTFMLVTSFGGLGRYNSSGTLPAAEIALREINNRLDILPGYNLVYDEVRDSQVS